MTKGTESPERIAELLHRNLQEVFGEADGVRRRAAIEALWTEDGLLYVPGGILAGHDAINTFAGDLRTTHPDYVYTPCHTPQVLPHAGKLAWGSGPPGGAAAYTGTDLIIVRDGRIKTLYVFLDQP